MKENHELNKRSSLILFIFISLFLVISIVRIFNHNFHFQNLKLSSVIDKNVEKEMARQKLEQKNRKANHTRKFNDWRDDALSKVEAVSFIQARRISQKLYDGRTYDPGEAAAVVVAELGIHNPDMELITKKVREKLNPANIRRGLETAHQNQAALYFSLPLIKDSIIQGIEEIPGRRVIPDSGKKR